jgi:hypothetical protein
MKLSESIHSAAFFLNLLKEIKRDPISDILKESSKIIDLTPDEEEVILSESCALFQFHEKIGGPLALRTGAMQVATEKIQKHTRIPIAVYAVKRNIAVSAFVRHSSPSRHAKASRAIPALW